MISAQTAWTQSNWLWLSKKNSGSKSLMMLPKPFKALAMR
ncbi:UNVERIFIED_CONTAM: hypothetical protein GTU68_022076 [Idotea baltica]|nr:hypothetical protein [Idotea baltica]